MYRSVVGSLQYLVNSRLDLAYSMGYISRFMEKTTIENLAVVKRVMCYIARTLNFGYHYKMNNGVA